MCGEYTSSAVIAAASTAAAAIDQPWIDADTAAGKTISRNHLLGLLLSELLPLLSRFEAGGFARLRQEWSELDSIGDRPVAVHLGERIVIGTAAGVNDSGALLVDTPQGRQIFHGGEVSLRLQP
jgi:BirA family biotin operon repressor/biotin-[acetyl-CoA-carboxylase] ligase